jgi:hypothetical protein
MAASEVQDDALLEADQIDEENQIFRCRHYENKYPEVDDKIVVQVKSIIDTGARARSSLRLDCSRSRIKCFIYRVIISSVLMRVFPRLSLPRMPCRRLCFTARVRQY